MKKWVSHTLLFIYIIVIQRTRSIDLTHVSRDITSDLSQIDINNDEIDISKFVVLTKDEKSSSGFVKVDLTKYLLEKNDNIYHYRFKDCCKCSILKYGDQIVWTHDFDLYGYYYPREIILSLNEIDIKIKNYILTYTLNDFKLNLNKKTSFNKYIYKDFTIITLDNDNKQNINNIKQFDIFNYSIGLVIFRFKNNAKCIKVIFNFNVIWKYDENLYLNDYPKCIIYRPDGHLYVDFETNFYVFNLDSTSGNWTLNTNLSSKNSSLLDFSEHPSCFTIITADDLIGTNLKINDTNMYKLYNYFEGSYLYVFSPEVKCHEVKYDNNSLWKYDENLHLNKYPKSLFFDLTHLVFDLEFEDETLRFKSTELGFIKDTIKNIFQVTLEHGNNYVGTSISENFSDKNLRTNLSDSQQTNYKEGIKENNYEKSSHYNEEESISLSEITLNSDTLIKLYQNDYYYPFMHLYHLYHEKEPYAHECLVNMLYNKRSNEEILFYLPQLCQLSISNENSNLYQFLLDKSSVSINIALQFYWLYHGSIEQIQKNGGLKFKTSFILPNAKTDNSEGVSNTFLLDRSSVKDINTTNPRTNLSSLLKPQMPKSLVYGTDTLSSSVSNVQLIGVQTKLGNPLDLETLPTLDYTDDLQMELLKLMNKKKLNYFNTVTNFVDLCMQNSSLLIKESNRESREPLLKVFVNALNEWMLLRRCTVAAYEKRFAYTGLSLPFDFLNNYQDNGYNHSDKNDQLPKQILRIVEDETKIFFSKKRAPFVFYFEMANLDEDIEFISYNKDKKEFSIKDLYVFDTIVNDLLRYNLITKTQVELIKNPIECIRFVLGMLPNESLEKYKNIFNDKTESDCKNEVSESCYKVDTTVLYANYDKNIFIDTGSYEDSDLTADENIEHLELTEDSDYDNLGINNSQSYESDKNVKDSNLEINFKTIEENILIKDGIENNKDDKEKENKNLDIEKLSQQEIRNIIFPEIFEQKKERIRKNSPYGLLKSWDLYPFVIKGSDDLRQEKIAIQLIETFRIIFNKANIPLWLKPIQILVTGTNSVIMELIKDSYSVNSIKRKLNVSSLATVFNKLFESNLEQARKNFIESHAAYSIITYLFRVKDRHNGNILLDNEGHVIHIDYEFCLSNNPGFINLETSAFKLSNEYLEIIGGKDSEGFKYFKDLMIKGLLESRKHVEEIVLLVEIMSTANNMSCFRSGTSYAIKSLKDRFMINESEENCIKKIDQIINSSVNSFSTKQYDTHQRLTNGIK